MLKLQADKMKNAIARAKAGRRRVSVIDAANRIYSVSGSNGGEYTVRFVVVNGFEMANRNFAAGRRAQMWFPGASAAPVNIAVQSMRRENPTPAESQAFLSRNMGWMV